MIINNNDFYYDFKDFIRLILPKLEQDKIEIVLRQEMHRFVKELNENDFQVYPRWDKKITNGLKNI